LIHRGSASIQESSSAASNCIHSGTELRNRSNRAPPTLSGFILSSRKSVLTFTRRERSCRKWISRIAGIASSAQRPAGLARMRFNEVMSYWLRVIGVQFRHSSFVIHSSLLIHLS
jgi:hypothetical protein